MPAASASLMTWTGRPSASLMPRRRLEVDPACVDVGGGLHDAVLDRRRARRSRRAGRRRVSSASACAATRSTTDAIVSSDRLRRRRLGGLLADAGAHELGGREVDEGGLDAGAADVDAEREARERARFGPLTDGARCGPASHRMRLLIAAEGYRSADRPTRPEAASDAGGRAPIRCEAQMFDQFGDFKRACPTATRPRPTTGSSRSTRSSERARSRARPVHPLPAAEARPPARTSACRR